MAAQAPFGWIQTHPTVTGTHHVEVGVNEIVIGRDFGFALATYDAEIHGLVWHDADGDGTRSVTEASLEGWTVFLDQNGNRFLDPGEAFTASGVSGDYAFRNLLAPASYTVALQEPAGWVQTYPGATETREIVLDLHQIVTGLDFGFALGATIRGTIWDDSDGDGFRDPNETPLVGWTVFVDRDGNGLGMLESGEPLATTDENGNYVLDGLAAGTYRVTSTLQTGWAPTHPSGGVARSAPFEIVTLISGETLDAIDFGHRRGSLTGAINTAADAGFFAITITEAGRLTVRAEPNVNSSLDPQLSLFGPNGQLLVTSDDELLGSSAAFLQQHLEAGTYYIQVSASRSSETTGAYTLATHFVSGALEILLGTYDQAMIVTGDFNGDDRLDLATANYFSNDVSVLLGNGDGSFAFESRYSAGFGPISIVTGDFNGDGRLDLATANFYSDDVSVLLAIEGGSFASQARYRVGSGPNLIVTGDFNGDGNLDLAFRNDEAGGVSILIGLGNEGFQEEVRIVIGGGPTLVTGDFWAAAHALPQGAIFLTFVNWGISEATSVAVLADTTTWVGDINNDGRIDLAITTDFGNSDLEVFLGNSDGTFDVTTRISLGLSATAIAIADINGDRRLDVVAVGEKELKHEFVGAVEVHLGSGDGRFGVESLNLRPEAIASADLDRDGHLDLVIANIFASDLSILIGRGDGTFVQGARVDVGELPEAIVVGDFNGDGRNDIAVANGNSNDVSVLLGFGDGTFTEQARWNVGRQPLSIVTADFNRDGYLDLATANSNSDSVSILLGTGDERLFQTAIDIDVPGAPDPASIVVGDFNADGLWDIVTANHGDDNISVFLGNSDERIFHASAEFDAGENPYALVTADFDRDGNLDLAAISNDYIAISILLGNGSGAFFLMGQVEGVSSAESLVVGDFDGDELLDLAVASFLDDRLMVLFGLGTGGFGERILLGREDPDEPDHLVVGDFNEDGLLDLAAAPTLSNSLSVFLSLGDRSFINISYAPEQLIGAFVFADIDSDGSRDSIVMDQEGKILVRFARPNKYEEFKAPIVINPGFPAWDIAIVLGYRVGLGDGVALVCAGAG